MTNWIEHFNTSAKGMKISHVWRGHGSALFIEFGKLFATTHHDGTAGEPDGEIGLMIEWSWRIEDEQNIICGSWSEEALWQLTFERLLGAEVTQLSTFGRLPEILIALSNGLQIASFMTAEGQPQWTLFDRRAALPINVYCQSGIVQLGN